MKLLEIPGEEKLKGYYVQLPPIKLPTKPGSSHITGSIPDPNLDACN